MDEIRTPPQAILRQPHDDEERQSQFIQLRDSGQHLLREPRNYTNMPRIARLLAALKLEMLKPNYSLPLPSFYTQATQYPPTESVPRTPLGQTHRNLPEYPMIRSTVCRESGNQNTEAIERGSGVAAKPRNRKVIISKSRNEVHEKCKKELLKVLEPAVDSDGSETSTIFLCWGRKNHCQIAPVMIANSASEMVIWQEIRRAWYKQKIANYRPQEFPCQYNSSTGQVNCNFDCVTYTIDDIACP